MSEDVLSGMYVLSGWTFCQGGRFVRIDVLSGRTFCQEEPFCKEDLMLGLHFQGKTQTQTPDNHS